MTSAGTAASRPITPTAAKLRNRQGYCRWANTGSNGIQTGSEGAVAMKAEPAVSTRK
jgi:hypothetical protein